MTAVHKYDTGKDMERLANRVKDLGVTDGNDGFHKAKNLTALVHDFSETAATLLRQVGNIEKFLHQDGQLVSEDNSAIRTVYRNASQVNRAAQGLCDTAVQAVVTHVTSLVGKKSRDTFNLLEYFDGGIRNIVKSSFSKPKDFDSTWRIVEECYNQATIPSGRLDSDNYVVSITRPDISYHPMEDIGARERLAADTKRNIRDEWVWFWAQSLNRCLGGPTLFLPPKMFSPFIEPTPPAGDPPKYLFRAYNSMSWGINNIETIASVAHQTYDSNCSKKDVFSLAKQRGSKMLHGHLHGPYRSNRDDNLVSWSSSLMFVIQYANYRFVANGQNVFICAVDTTKFPKAQFVRDTWLLGRYSNANFNATELGFRRLRLEMGYDNGEYLSQGVLNIKGRSCTLSLSDLVQTGFWNLYPAFDINLAEADAPVRTKWTNFVKDLRFHWRDMCRTDKNELQVARNIARSCFTSFDGDEIALLLLAFRNRELKDNGKLSIPPTCHNTGFAQTSVKMIGVQLLGNQRKFLDT